MPDWLGDWLATRDWPTTAQVLVAFGTAILALFTFRLAQQTKRLADEAVAAREAEERPWLVAYPAYRGSLLQLVIENVGRSVASRCVVQLDYDETVYHLLDYGLVLNESQIPGGAKVVRQLADHVPGVPGACYPAISVRCHWTWDARSRDLDAFYTVDPGIALPLSLATESIPVRRSYVLHGSWATSGR